MKLIVGFVIVLGCVAGGYVLSHGELLALWQPYELLIIAGAAFGAFIVSNPPKTIKAVFGGLPRLLGGTKYNKQSYLELLTLMYDLFAKARKEGLMALENDIEEPAQSEIFTKYPKILKNHHAVEFITDYLRIMVGGNMNAFELENLMDLELETHHHEAETPAHAVSNVADGLPGFGIVAAVMGVVITMGSLNEPPEVLGHHIAAALVGTFLGILLAYGFVGPMAKAMEAQAQEESKFLECIKVCILATLNGYTPQIAIEFGRKVIYSTDRPGFLELEEHVKQNK
ncbi:MAG: flagellar motor protein MotA [Gammaproteobacteria bacterium SG8_47]|nr:MAG: flagellar motor protein MotA [Gammaproteobacteria bacterium SG8_47]